MGQSEQMMRKEMSKESNTDAPQEKSSKITESSHYDQLIQLIDDRWDQKQQEIKETGGKGRQSDEKEKQQEVNPRWGSPIAEHLRKKDRQIQEEISHTPTREGRAIGQSSGMPEGKWRKGHAKGDATGGKSAQRQWDKGDQMIRTKGKQHTVEKNKTEKSGKYRDGATTGNIQGTAPHRQSPRWEDKQDPIHRESKSSRQGKESIP